MFDLTSSEVPPERCDLAPGLQVTVRPLTGALDCRAAAEVAQATHDLRAGGAAAARFGLDPGDLSAPGAKAGLALFARAVVLGSLLIAKWSVARDGAPASVTEANVAALFNRHPAAMTAFLHHVDDAARRAAEAGEVFAASPNTPSAGAASTAEAVTSSPSPAPAESPAAQATTAPPSSTPRVIRKPSRPGAPSADTQGSGDGPEPTE